ncbi:hypothetical protein [uncultured Vibrio sp.]|uniref:hypothetical protein n=1 Tax=uncultured Vibrio sp. TaxID=114054 RepID=UPI0025F3CBAB|nr:hypothetical protein [uncultured Vibrio sp.]
MIRTFYASLLISLFLSSGVVAKQIDAPDGLMPFSTVEVKKAEVVVGTPAIVTIKLFVPTYFKGEADFPIYDSINLIVKELNQEPPEKARNIEGRDWTVISKKYWMLPMQAGDYSFAAQSASGTYPDPENSRRIDTRFQISGFSFSATIPAGAQALEPLIVAEQLTLEQSWEGADKPLEESGAVTRSVVASIKGSSALFIPALIEPHSSELVKVYPAGQVVTDLETYKGLGGSREERVSYVAQFGGEVSLPELSVQWFNSKTGEIETATVAGRSIVINASEKPEEPLLSKKKTIVLTSLLLCLSLIIWAYRKWLSPVVISILVNIKLRRKESESFAAQQVLTAIQEHNLSRVYNTVEVWMAHQDVTDTQSLQAFEGALLAISKYHFGGGKDASWTIFEQTFLAMRKKAKSAKQSKNKLPELNTF